MRNGTRARAPARSNDATSHGHVVQLLLTALRHDKLISSSSLLSSPPFFPFFCCCCFYQLLARRLLRLCVCVCSSEQCDAATRKKPSKFSAFLKLVPTSAARSQKERKKERRISQTTCKCWRKRQFLFLLRLFSFLVLLMTTSISFSSRRR